MSAQAFHWIETSVGLAKASQLLHDSGAIALVWTLGTSHETAFYKAAAPIYDKYIPATPNRPTPEEGFERYKGALTESSLFGEVTEHSVPWTQTYSKENFLKLHDTFSNHRVLSERTRAAFHKELGDLIDMYGGSVLQFYKTGLLLARHQG